jgi:hypothetical protein
MLKFIRNGGWLSSLLIFFTPVFLIMFLGTVLAHAQVKGEFTATKDVKEFTSLAALESVPEGEVVMLRGQIAEGPALDWAGGLVVFQERPLDGRETRFLETFPLVFPTFYLQLADGAMPVQPSVEHEPVILHELQRIVDEPRDREYTGFRIGDTLTVQGTWSPESASSEPALVEATGLSSIDRAGIIGEGETAFQRLNTIRLVLGALTLIGSILLFIQWRRVKAQEALDQTEESELRYG